MGEVIDSLPALSSVDTAYPGIIVLLLIIATIGFRWRKEGFVSGPETMMAIGAAIGAASSATLAEGQWPRVVLGIGLAALVFGAITDRVRKKRRGLRNERDRAPSTSA